MSAAALAAGARRLEQRCPIRVLAGTFRLRPDRGLLEIDAVLAARVFLAVGETEPTGRWNDCGALATGSAGTGGLQCPDSRVLRISESGHYSLFSVACLSPPFAAECDELRGRTLARDDQRRNRRRSASPTQACKAKMGKASSAVQAGAQSARRRSAEGSRARSCTVAGQIWYVLWSAAYAIPAPPYRAYWVTRCRGYSCRRCRLARRCRIAR
jgi:hypothetical protein